MSQGAAPGSRLVRLGQTVFALVGALWAARSLQSFTDPDFTDPESAADWWAVIAFSLAWAVLPAGLSLLIRITRRGGRASGMLLVIVALGASTTAVANFVEDGVGVQAAGHVYFIAAVITMLSLIVLTGALLVGRPRWPGLVVPGTLIGMLNLELGGGILVLLVWGAAAAAVQPRTTS